MGSAVHAASLEERHIKVKLMISLEMIGYYCQELFCQDYSPSIMYLFFPWTGDYIAVVGTMTDRRAVAHIKNGLQKFSNMKVQSINAPAAIPGVDFSDHKNYLERNWPAVMITDTAFNRNHSYHQMGDTPDKLNYDKMADLIQGLSHTLLAQ
jgi:hypothetical protein